MVDARLRLEPSTRKQGLRDIIKTTALKLILAAVYHFVDKEALLAQREKNAIRRDVGRFFLITVASKVCSLHLKRTDLSKDLNWWTFVCQNRRFSFEYSWKKRLHESVLPFRNAISATTGEVSISWVSILVGGNTSQKTPEAENDIRETGTNFNNETATSSEFAEANAYSTKKMPSADDENNLSNSTDQFRLLDEKCADLENKVSDLEGKNRTPSSNSFSLNRFILLIRQCYILYRLP